MFGIEHIGGFLGMMNRPYQTQLRCYSMPYFAMADAHKINTMNHGGNILLPNSALDNLTRLNVQYPLLFKVTNPSLDHQRVTHAGVLEFLAEEGKCYMPAWMMRQLQLQEGSLAIIEYKSLPMATFAKFKPMSTDFLSISNPRAILEIELRKYRCLSKNDLISIAYNDQVLEFKVMDLQPQNAVSITECDVNLEFDTPEGYVEPTPVFPQGNAAQMPDAPPNAQPVKPKGWSAFSGEGMRLDGRKTKVRTISTNSNSEQPGASGSQQQIQPSSRNSSCSSMQTVPASGKEAIAEAPEILVDENYLAGSLRFVRYNYKNRSALERERKQAEEEQKNKGQSSGSGASPFAGSGQTIRR